MTDMPDLGRVFYEHPRFLISWLPRAAWTSEIWNPRLYTFSAGISPEWFNGLPWVTFPKCNDLAMRQRSSWLMTLNVAELSGLGKDRCPSNTHDRKFVEGNLWAFLHFWMFFEIWLRRSTGFLTLILFPVNLNCQAWDEQQHLGARSILRATGQHRGMERQGGREVFQGSTRHLKQPKLLVEN
jgi:hypothetical protein